MRGGNKMLSRIFNADNAVFRFFQMVGEIWWLHFLWLVCSLPVVTLGASTTALIYSCMKLRKREGYATRNFFHSFRENFRQSTLLFLFFVVCGSILMMDLLLCRHLDSFIGQFIKYGAAALMIPYFMTLLYAFAIQAKFVNSVKKTLQYAFALAGKYFVYTLQMALIVAGFLALNTTIVLVNFITLSIGVGVVVYILSLYYDKIFSEIVERTEME